MILLLLAYVGGVLTILSPCILPVLPFVFARAGQPFMRSSLPLLLGMAVTFALIATLAAVGGGWAVEVNKYGRLAAILLLGFFGLTLLFPALSERMTRPLVALGTRLSESSSQATREGRSSIIPSLLLGFATGLLWAPCAGPILGLILTGAALQGANAQTSLLLLAYALGAATSLALALLVGGKVFAALKRSLGAGEWIRRGLGVAVLAGVVAIALGLDTGVLAQLSLTRTTSIEQTLLERIAPKHAASTVQAPASAAPGETLPVEGPMPSIAGAVEWLNSPPLSNESLRGKVVLIDFWTYSCINCLRTLPYLRAWADKYRDQGLVIIGVHAPEFAFEKDIANVRSATKELGITYPVAIDNKFAIWRAFENNFWPAHYFADAQGRIRHHHFGEGEYDESEKVIQQLLAEAGHTNVKGGLVNAVADGVGLQSDWKSVRSPETFVGYARAENFVSHGGQVKDKAHVYVPATAFALNDWSLAGNWKVGREEASLLGNTGKIIYRFKARDLHLVLGPGPNGKPVRFRVRLDGAAPADAHGGDIDKTGAGSVTEQRLYQLIRQSGEMKEMTFEIEFLDPGVQAFAFTFG
ncbi:MAG TPA: cytochrome c biogenesis protein DipZ [Rhodocyclaceae bacterium]|nr:cytochrome c biogenesis protein DipZ [Rhodocyclaceae bacterium]